MNERNPQRLAGWLLGIWLLIHQLPPAGMAGAAILVVIIAGLILRGLRIQAPVVIERVCLAGTILIPLAPGSPLPELSGNVASWIAAVLLLRSLTPRRGLWILLCAIAVLASMTLDPFANFPAFVLVFDVAALMLLAQQVHAPEGSGRGIREIVFRSVRLVVPVGLVVTAAFWLFPALSWRTNAALTGFADGLNPGAFSELRPSRRVAFVATFPQTGPVPSAEDLYWRGQVLEKNEGLRWSLDPARSPEVTRPSPQPTWRYSLLISHGRPFAPLDRPVNSPDGGLVHAHSAADPLPVESSASPADDSPDIASPDLEVPDEISADSRMQALASGLVSPSLGVRKTLESLAAFLGSSGFLYTLQPGKMRGVPEFLTVRRKGFCEHYAAACANLLRMAGIPARVVSGYRGGRWNPWLRTITVRDSSAHAWVEAWDASARHWIRFDPTTSVAPELTLQIETDRDPGRWPWHRHALTFAESLVSAAGGWLASAARAAPSALAGFAILSVAVWALLRRRIKTDPAQAALARLEKYASRRGMGRRPGESPLAWLARLQNAAGGDPDLRNLKSFAASYEQIVYSPAGMDARAQSDLARASEYFHRKR